MFLSIYGACLSRVCRCYLLFIHFTNTTVQSLNSIFYILIGLKNILKNSVFDSLAATTNLHSFYWEIFFIKIMYCHFKNVVFWRWSTRSYRATSKCVHRVFPWEKCSSSGSFVYQPHRPLIWKIYSIWAL